MKVSECLRFNLNPHPTYASLDIFQSPSSIFFSSYHEFYFDFAAEVVHEPVPPEVKYRFGSGKKQEVKLFVSPQQIQIEFKEKQ